MSDDQLQQSSFSDAAQIEAHLRFLHPAGPWVIGVASNNYSGITAIAFRDLGKAVAYAADQTELPATRAVYVALTAATRRFVSRRKPLPMVISPSW